AIADGCVRRCANGLTDAKHGVEPVAQRGIRFGGDDRLGLTEQTTTLGMTDFDDATPEFGDLSATHFTAVRAAVLGAQVLRNEETPAVGMTDFDAATRGFGDPSAPHFTGVRAGVLGAQVLGTDESERAECVERRWDREVARDDEEFGRAVCERRVFSGDRRD